MAENKPDFLQNLGDTPEEKDLLTSLDGEPEGEQNDENKTDDSESESDDSGSDNAAGDEKKEDGEDGGSDNEDGGEKSDENGDGENKAEQDGDKKEDDGTEKPEDKDNKSIQGEKVEDKKPEDKKIFGKYKTIEDAEKGHKELESAFGRVNAMLEGYKTGKIPANIPEGSAALLKMAETPMVRFNKPNIREYTDADGILDVESYMGEYTKNLIVGIQKSILGGPLAAAQFGILQDAMKEESKSRIEANRRDMESEEISEKLYTNFPILKKNKDIEETVSNAIIGAKLMRKRQAEANGEAEPVFTYEDYEKIVSSILGNGKTINSEQKVDKVEKINPSPTFKSNGTRGSEIDDIIDGMAKVSSKSSIF